MGKGGLMARHQGIATIQQRADWAHVPMRPSGPMNMFATECSMPMQTKAEMGNQMPTLEGKQKRSIMT